MTDCFSYVFRMLSKSNVYINTYFYLYVFIYIPHFYPWTSAIAYCSLVTIAILVFTKELSGNTRHTLMCIKA